MINLFVIFKLIRCLFVIYSCYIYEYKYGEHFLRFFLECNLLELQLCVIFIYLYQISNNYINYNYFFEFIKTFL